MSVQCLSGGPSVRARLTSALLLGRDGVELIQDTRDISRDTRFDDRQEAGLKPAHVIDWSETDDSECNVAERCATGDPQACQDLVDTHQRMVYHLALQLLNNHEPSTCRKTSSSQSSGQSTASGAIRLCRPGSIASSSTTRGTGNAGGDGVGEPTSSLLTPSSRSVANCRRQLGRPRQNSPSIKSSWKRGCGER